jgi:hypothetical protein
VVPVYCYVWRSIGIRLLPSRRQNVGRMSYWCLQSRVGCSETSEYGHTERALGWETGAHNLLVAKRDTSYRCAPGTLGKMFHRGCGRAFRLSPPLRINARSEPKCISMQDSVFEYIRLQKSLRRVNQPSKETSQGLDVRECPSRDVP